MAEVVTPPLCQGRVELRLTVPSRPDAQSSSPGSSIVVKRRHVCQYRINSGMEDVHDLVGLERAVASPCSLRPEYAHVDEHGDGCIRGRERDAQPFDQYIDGNHGLAEEEIGKAPHHRMFADAAFLQVFAPLVGDGPQFMQQMYCVATRGYRALEEQLNPV
jgi:hypothetical protein